MMLNKMKCVKPKIRQYEWNVKLFIQHNYLPYNKDTSCCKYDQLSQTNLPNKSLEGLQMTLTTTTPPHPIHETLCSTACLVTIGDSSNVFLTYV